jgi:hypothetical protein
MPMKIIDLDCGIGSLISGIGVVTEDEYVDSIIRHLTQNADKFKKYRYNISDYTAVTEVKVPTKSVAQIADYCKIAAIVNPDAVVAVVANQNLTYGLSIMWQILVDETGWAHEVFRNRGDAESWTKGRVKEKYGTDDITFR